MMIYVAQYGFVWRLTPAQWLAECKNGVQGRGYDLTPYRLLKRLPRGIHRDRDTGDLWTSRNDIVLVQPLDWGPDDFSEYLKYF
jgi:hypothetical protein